MMHRICFRQQVLIDFSRRRTDRLEQALVYEGQIIQCQVRCYAIDHPDGPMEVADILYNDAELQCVPCEYFLFLDEEE